MVADFLLPFTLLERVKKEKPEEKDISSLEALRGEASRFSVGVFLHSGATPTTLARYHTICLCCCKTEGYVRPCILKPIQPLCDHMNSVTQYYTDQHASPLVVLSTLKIMYFKGKSNYGYFISTVQGHTAYARCTDHDSRKRRRRFWRTHFKIWSPVDQYEFTCTAWTHEWDHWIMNICKIQRLLRRKWLIHRFILNPNDPFGIRKIKAFLKSESP